MAKTSRNLTRLPDGRCRVTVVVAGRKTRKTFPGEATARQFLAALRLDTALRDVGLPGILRQRPIVLDLVRDFLADAEARSVAAATLEYYHACTAGPVTWLETVLRRPDLLADELDDRLIARYVAWRVGRRLGRSRRPASEVSAHKDLTILAMVYRHARVEQRWRKPARLATSLGGKRVLTVDELAAFLAALPVGSLARTVAEVAAATGMRGCDIRALTWPQLDFAARTITFVARKTGGHQILPMADSLAPHLEAWRDAPRSVERVDRSVFHLDGRLLRRESLRRPFREASRRAGIHPPIQAIGLTRNAVAAHLLERGESPYLVAALLGHADVRTTMGYVKRHRPAEALRATVRSLEASRVRASGPVSTLGPLGGLNRDDLGP